MYTRKEKEKEKEKDRKQHYHPLFKRAHLVFSF
jgi:hypothetical protein